MAERGAKGLCVKHFAMKLGVVEAAMLAWLSERNNRSKGSIVRELIRGRYEVEKRAMRAEAEQPSGTYS